MLFLNQAALIQGVRKNKIRAHRLRAILKTQFTMKPGDDTPFCAACNHHCAEWVDWSKTYRNAICPRCFSFPRHRLLSLFLREQADVWEKPQKILHFAPEPVIKKYLKRHKSLDYTTADLNMPFVDINIDITKIPFPDNTFDVVICNHVLEHILDDRKAMGEILRILKPGGWASLMVPIKHKLETTYEDASITSPKDRLKHFGQEDHVRWYGLDYADRLRESGFQVSRKNYSAEFSQAKLDKLGLRAKEEIYVGTKPN